MVVFRHPVNGSDFIKRVVGLPGDTVQMKEGRLHINDAPVGIERREFCGNHGAPGQRLVCARCKMLRLAMVPSA